jgi:hypothetical protein
MLKGRQKSRNHGLDFSSSWFKRHRLHIGQVHGRSLGFGLTRPYCSRTITSMLYLFVRWAFQLGKRSVDAAVHSQSTVNLYWMIPIMWHLPAAHLTRGSRNGCTRRSSKETLEEQYVQRHRQHSSGRNDSPVFNQKKTKKNLDQFSLLDK